MMGALPRSSQWFLNAAEGVSCIESALTGWAVGEAF
jgi:hypothetical protein